MQQYHLTALAEYITELHHINSAENIAADR